MALTRKTVIDQIEIRRDGTTQVRFGLLIMDGDAEIQTRWHRTAIPPGGDLDTQIALVETHLQAMGHPAVDADEKSRLRAVSEAVKQDSRSR